MRTFAVVRDWARPILNDAGFEEVSQYPGPSLTDDSGSHVIWTRYGGPGEDADGALDDISWQARCIGLQGDYDSAESLADTLDLALLSLFSQRIGGIWVTRVQRVGGAPSALMIDDADRTHMICSYVIGTELALTH